jgi:hypothetical protein
MTGLTSDGFQVAVNIYPAPAVPGDFAGANIRANVVGGSGQYVASPGGVTVGAMAWANPTTGVISSYYPGPNVAFPCFIHRNNQGLITSFLGYYTTQVQGNTEVTGMNQGDFWGLFAGSATATQKVYANPVTGALSSAATGNGVTATITSGGASISSGVLTTTDADVTGTPAVGQIVTSSGTGVPSGTYIASSAGTGSGTHLWNLANVDGTTIANVSAGSLTWALYGVVETQFYVAQTVQGGVTSTSCTIAAPVGVGPSVLTTSGALSSGTIQQGMFVTGTSVAANTEILYQLSGTAGAAGGATYAVTAQAAVNSFTATFAGGLLGKISSLTRST